MRVTDKTYHDIAPRFRGLSAEELAHFAF